VDDDPKVLALAGKMLRNLGYQVSEAAAFEHALKLLTTGGGVDLLFSDAVKADSHDGSWLVHEARRLHPSLKVLRTSGNSGEGGAREDLLPFVAKPYTTSALARAVRTALDAT
jgi:DNA-binding NtrC family response regulator